MGSEMCIRDSSGNIAVADRIAIAGVLSAGMRQPMRTAKLSARKTTVAGDLGSALGLKNFATRPSGERRSSGIRLHAENHGNSSLRASCTTSFAMTPLRIHRHPKYKTPSNNVIVGRTPIPSGAACADAVARLSAAFAASDPSSFTPTVFVARLRFTRGFAAWKQAEIGYVECASHLQRESVSTACDRGACPPHHSRYENQARWTTCDYEARKHARMSQQGLTEEQSCFAPRRQGARTWQRELLHVRATPTDRHGGICAGVASERSRNAVRRSCGHDSLACGGQHRGGTFGGHLHLSLIHI